MKPTEFIEQAQFPETLVNSISDSVIATDLHGNIVYWNPAAEELYKWKFKEVKGKNITEIYPPIKTKKLAEEIMKSIKNGNSWEGEFDVQDKNGKAFPVQVIESPLIDRKGNLKGIIGISKDISESNIAGQDILKESKKKYKDIFENLIDEVHIWKIIKDNKGKITSWELIDANPSALKAWGKTKKQVIGKTANEIFEFNSHNKFMSLVESIINTGKPQTWEEYFPPTNQYLSMDSIPFGDYFISTGRDITERRIAEQTIKDIEERLNLIVNESPFPVVIADLNDENIIYWSKSAKELTGYAPKTVSEWYELAYPDEEYRKEVFERWKPFVDEARKSKEAINGGEYQITCENGSKINVEFYVQFIPGNLVVTFNDITEHKKTENALKEQNQYLAKLNNSLQSVVFTVDIGTRKIEYVNNRVKAIFGYEPDECIGNTTEFLYPGKEAFLEYGKQMRAAVQNNQEFLQTESILRRKTGELFDTEITTSFLSDSNVVAVITDITNEKKAELELVNAKEKAEESEKQLRLISDNFVNGMIYQVAMLDEDTRQFNYLSKNVKELYGCTPEEAKKDPSLIYGKIHPEDIGRLVEKEKEALKTMSTFETEARTISSDGSVRWAYYISKPRLIHGVVCWDGIEIDITERKKMELELISAKEKAEESDRLKSAFLANMSHEIRTPMNGIMGFTSLLQGHDLTSEQQQSYIEIIKKSGNRMLNTVNDIIEISKIETGQISVSSTEVNISNHLKSLYDFFSLEANKKGLQLIIDNKLSEDESFILTDKNKISSILSNLIKNAIKFTDKGYIKIGCEKKNTSLEMYVEDTGIGIPESRIDAIFNRFEQADIEDKLVHEGSGLGLAITKSYVEMLGGKIWVKSEKNKGSKFYFTIANKPIKTEVKRSREISNPTSEIAININILIVEDDEPSSLFLSTVLQDYARNIHVVTNGLEAVEYCKNNPNVELVLMDLKLPLLNGYESTRRIREFNKDVIIIAQTAHALEGDRDIAIEAGCNDYIAKPINEQSLLGLIQKIRSTK